MILQICKNHTTLQSASDHIPRAAPWWNTVHFQLSEFIFLTRYKVARDISDIAYPAYVRLITNRASFSTVLHFSLLIFNVISEMYRAVLGHQQGSHLYTNMGITAW